METPRGSEVLTGVKKLPLRSLIYWDKSREVARELAPPVEAQNQEVAALTYTNTPTQTCFLLLFPSLAFIKREPFSRPGRKHICNAPTMASVLSARLFVAALSGGACNLWTYLHEEADCSPLVQSCGGEKRAKNRYGGESVFGSWRSGTDVDCGSLIMGRKKRSRRLFSPLISPPADVCSGAPAGVASRHFISPSKRPSH